MSLNQPQKDAIDTIYGPLLVLAGAGSGKTRVVTYRIANLLKQGVDPSSILGLTFTNKAAGEMKERVQQLTNTLVLICTFHSLGARILREAIHVLGYKRDFTIYDDSDIDKVVKLCINELGSDQKLEVKNIVNFISSCKNKLISPENIDHKALDSSEASYPAVYARYQALLKECNAVDFDDLLYLPVRIFREHPEMLAHYQNRWQFLLIDEYQDTNQSQYAIVRHLVEKHHNLCVVGDPDQSIYSWRGANIQNILDFEKDYPGAKVIRLEQNYRSRANILEASNALISYNRGRYEKNLWSDRGTGEKIKHFTADTERSEADFISNRIFFHYEKNNIPLKQMAIFYRTNAQSRAIEDKLLQHRIPYVIVGGVSFYQRREIKDVLAFLRMVNSGVDFVSFERTINLPKRGIGETTIEKIRIAASMEGHSLIGYCIDLVNGNPLQHPVRLSQKQKEALKSYLNIIHELREMHKGCSLKELVLASIQKTGYLEYLKGEMETFDDRKENLNSLVAKAAEWETSTAEPTLEGFLEELSLKSSLDEAESITDRVNLMTIHNGKGLEFEVVFLAGLEEDLFPHANSRDSSQALEEERRLCYVGMTRAKDYLYLCNVRQRFLWGTTRTQRPSRFLIEIPFEYIDKITLSSLSKSSPLPRRTPTQEITPEVTFIDDIDQRPFDDDDRLSPDTAVFHHEFGIGIVKQVYHGSAGLSYKILFSKDGRERNLVAKHAPLKKL